MSAAISLPPRRARQGFAVLARCGDDPWCVRVLVTGDGDDAACAPVQLDLSPARADMLAQELMQMAALARHPGRVPVICFRPLRAAGVRPPCCLRAKPFGRPFGLAVFHR